VTTLVCIGYGFGDIHINATFRDWLELSPDRRLEIVSPIAQLPSFLLHLAQQVTIIKSTATEYLDRVAGIVRSDRDDLEKRIAMQLRSMDATKAQNALASFHRLDQERIAEGFQEKLRQTVPIVDGKPDFTVLRDPNELAKKWAVELGATDEQLFQRLLKYLQAEDRS
jgi:hypothetical protein